MKRIFIIASILSALACAADVYLGTQRVSTAGGSALDERVITRRYLGDQLIFEASTSEIVLLTPAMTSNTTPAPFVVSASSSYQAQGEWRAFNRVSSTNNEWANNGASASGQWLQIDLGASRHIDRIVLFSRVGSLNQTPKSVIINNNDSGSPVQIGAASGYPIPAAGGVVFADIQINSVARIIRISCGTPFSGNFVSIGEVEIYGY
jgi:hypothetical protein